MNTDYTHHGLSPAMGLLIIDHTINSALASVACLLFPPSLPFLLDLYGHLPYLPSAPSMGLYDTVSYIQGSYLPLPS
ncbi:hypothetical protein BO71DRAFT_401862 [Aspergillus ellipticus CBS 707.79]|uniref:Uncharacterized protein n=1 Tax=Aspergillus ellipticus CBS 707.79 TaxID=1448320 RepID=A0A319EIP3_9EURO|nr:hypothetical protein BO71DRAFT_401862 [Aspergillus ellipticus CBS 707.79]